MREKLLKEEKPLTEESKKRLNELAKMLACWLEKRDIEKHFNCTERSARDMISTVAKRTAVISKSNSKGYKRALTPSDLEPAKQTRNEILSRIRELSLRLEQLDKFISEQEDMEVVGNGR